MKSRMNKLFRQLDGLVEEIFNEAGKEIKQSFKAGKAKLKQTKPYEPTSKHTHKWRAVAIKNQTTPARHCSPCNTTEQLTEAEFFAHFGQHFPVVLSRIQHLANRG